MKKIILFPLLIGLLLAVIHLEQVRQEKQYPPHIKELLDETCQCSGMETIQAITLKLQNLQDQVNTNTKTMKENQDQLKQNTDYITSLQKKIVDTQKELEDATKPH